MKYFVNANAQATGEHEVHRANCKWLPAPENRIDLGECQISRIALLLARYKFDNVDGCKYCCPEIHRR